MSDITDDECIALALLHAKDLWFFEWMHKVPGFEWGCLDADMNSGDYTDQIHWRDASGPTKGAAARKYCQRHNLLG